MKHAIHISALVCALVVVAAPTFPAAQAPASIKAEMLKDWADLKGTMVKIASAMPADKYGFKPTPAQQSFGDRVVHIANINNRFLGSKRWSVNSTRCRQLTWIVPSIESI